MLWGLLWASALLLTGCGGGAADSADDGRIRIVATTTILEDVARQIAGDDAIVVGIMKVGEDPHVYDVRPGDAVTISRADLVLANGFHLEATLGGVIKQVAKGKVVHLADAAGITPLGSEVYVGAPDPHIWMDVKLFMKCAAAVRDAMIEVDPANQAGYEARAEAYLAEMQALDDWVRQEVQQIPKERRVVVTSHDAFNYYAAAYDIEVYGVIGISTDAQPKASDIEKLRNLIAERGVRAMFVETSVSKALNDIVRNIAADTNASIGGTLFSDSLGAPGTPGGTYLGMIRHNTNTMVKALR